MSAQNRIAQLCEEALRVEDAEPAKVPASVAAALAKFTSAPVREEPQPESSVKPQPAPEAVAEAAKPEVKAVDPVETDPELRELLEEREVHLNKKHKRGRLIANCMLLLIFGGTATAFVVSPTLRGKLDTFVFHLRGGVEDVKGMGNMMGAYDEALAGVAQRGNQIDDATTALGIDPASVSEDEDPHMQAEMDAMMGNEHTVGERNAKLGAAGALVTAITGRKAPEVSTERAE